MSAKTIAVLDASELKDGNMKEVDFEDGKVLLYRLDDKVHATSAWCTHYGAPLAKGVLTADGRVTWYFFIRRFHVEALITEGIMLACFNVCTGDIEEAPALMSLHTFKTEVKDGKIHVTAVPADTQKKNLARQPKLVSTGANSTGKGVVIVGGGPGAFHAVETLREVGYPGPINILTKEEYPPIDRTKLSKALTTDPNSILLRTAADLKIKYGTNVRVGTEVTSIDTEKKTVTIGNNEETIPYDGLILATGSIPRKLPVEGADLENVYTFRGIDDAKRVDTSAQEGKRVVFIGSSFIALELIVCLSKRKLASIDVVGMEEFPLENVLGKAVGAGLKKHFENMGVKFHMSTKVDKIVARDDDPKLAKEVIVNGEPLACDFVVMAVGARPATDFLKGSGIELEADGGIRVDRYLRVRTGRDTKLVFAIGDIAHYPLPTGEEVRIEHWNVAANMGRAVGAIMCGNPWPYTKIPVFWSALGQQLRYTGLGLKWDDIKIVGDPDSLKFIAYYIKKSKIVAVASMQNDPVVSKAAELFRLGIMPVADYVISGEV
ncbi:hypothetical protein CVT24_009325 [Panaeolus cyanescens]|uniref:Rieske domain-containing protein n=1 Tax=Panaeolus cyanescens TaxID=181874 RepID=A0A409Y7R2_9AGAR|nr:hypothetical protein CVT24_009325 [Panaeolus cyanescens]